MQKIEKLETLIEQINETMIDPIKSKIRKEIEAKFDENYASEVLDQTPCYRCLVPIPPADDKLVAACTLKGIPRNRNHCVIKAEVDFEKIFDHKPDLNNDEEVLKLMELAQEELEKLRKRVFNENIPPEKRDFLTQEEITEWQKNIIDTFGPDYHFEEMENILGNKIAAIQTVSSIIASIQSQEALKLLFRVNGRNIGPPMDPPYVNYNGVYGQFDHLDIIKRDECLACGKITGEENVNIVVPFDANVGYIFEAMEISGFSLDPEVWMITNPMSKEIIWNPLVPSLKDPNYKLKALKINSNDIISMTPLGKAREEFEIKKYNVIITYM
jgi:molybdopterin/thiamine biosynthesis adenylyltransferase